MVQGGTHKDSAEVEPRVEKRQLPTRIELTHWTGVLANENNVRDTFVSLLPPLCGRY